MPTNLRPLLEQWRAEQNLPALAGMVTRHTARTAGP